MYNLLLLIDLTTRHHDKHTTARALVDDATLGVLATGVQVLLGGILEQKFSA